ncbi:MAG: aminotransferase class III-fold pyridoxal phosphate-dependent enzyme [Chloroflexaceae bacterium]|nr:aminotransferase class III-fold pyridoxal phosphate-dependent enzyme [Chloroflexaceae bacterium]
MTSESASPALHDAQNYLLQVYPRPDFVLERGEGAYLYDETGRRYLDFVAGIAVNALGYGDAGIARVLSEHASGLIHVSNLYAFFCNSGAEAIEGAIKFARRFARDNVGEGKTTVVAFDGSFHGRTMGAVAITAREKYRTPFMPVMPDVRFADYNDAASLEHVMGDDVCAVVLEPVQGEGGLRVATPEFMARVRELCDQHKALLVLDEIQCGMGRTGTLWAHETYNVRPDMLTTAKPLANGLPIGAVLMNQCVADAIHPGDHGTTFGGGPLVTAVAGAVLERISDPEFLAHVRAMSSYLDESLHDLASELPGRILELRGRGLMRGLRIEGSASAVREAAHDAGLLVATAGEDVVRLLPPLIIENQHVDEAVGKLRRILA